MADKADIPDEIVIVLRDLQQWLDTTKTPYAIIGGVGVSLLARVRTTQDVDAVIWLDTESLESFIETGLVHNLVPRISDAADFARRNRVLLLQHRPTGINVDLSCGALPFDEEMVARARTLISGSLKINVATP